MIDKRMLVKEPVDQEYNSEDEMDAQRSNSHTGNNFLAKAIGEKADDHS